jgi:hypothetical protein
MSAIALQAHGAAEDAVAPNLIALSKDVAIAVEASAASGRRLISFCSKPYQLKS